MSVGSLDLHPELKSALTLEIPSNNEPFLSTSLSFSTSHTPPYSDDSGIPTPTTTVETTQSELITPVPTTNNAIGSSSSLPALNVKFAPLPELLPRKRRSTAPLGMAARGQLMRRRSGYRDRNTPLMWTDEGPEEHRRQHEELAARHARLAAYAAYDAAREEEKDDENEDENWTRQRRRAGRKNGKGVDEVDDPLLALGRMVKVAGRTLWKRVSNKDVAAAATAAATSTPNPKEGPKEQEDAANGQSNTGSPTPTKTSRPPSPALLPILGNGTSNVDDHHIEEYEEEEEEGGAWDEEVGDSFPRNVGQTETIIEGRAVYSRLTSKVEVSRNSPPPSPTLLNSKRMSSFMPPFKAKLVDGGS